MRVSRKRRSQSSTASQRSSSGVRFQRSHFVHTTQRRPRAASKARRRPTGNDSTTSLVPRGLWQNIQEVYTALPVGSRVSRAPDVTRGQPVGDLFFMLRSWQGAPPANLATSLPDVPAFRFPTVKPPAGR